MEDVRRQIGRRIQGLRKEAGLTQEALAERLGFHGSYVGLLERGAKSPSLETLSRIADFFNMSVVDLFQAEDASKDLEVRRIVKALKRVEKRDLKRVYTILGILVDE